mmetsp:Transcript_27770/g.48469  ORF Transcript_27770/g.48469 Transcript_27770/m.48469 type:complete len:388 (+) Transcript_27770:85-1248(+)
MSSDRPKPPSKLCSGRYEVEKKLGAGCFGEVWRGRIAETKEEVAVKFEDVQGHALQLEHESDVLKLLAKPTRPQGVADCLYFGREGRYHCMVMELLGKSLEERMQGCGNKFNARTVSLVGEQVLHRIEYLHSKGIVHRDIKPENFMFGIGPKIHHLYLIDFGLTRRYFNHGHVQMRTKLSLVGTARYASINAHRGVEQSRRDDVEAIGHLLIYFLRGSLPWSGLVANTNEEKCRKVREKKEQVPISDLCKGYPQAFARYLQVARGLEFQERPKYEELRSMFRDVRHMEARKLGMAIEDHSYQWFDGKSVRAQYGELVPLVRCTNVQQPDEMPRKSCFSLWDESSALGSITQLLMQCQSLYAEVKDRQDTQLITVTPCLTHSPTQQPS